MASPVQVADPAMKDTTLDERQKGRIDQTLWGYFSPEAANGLLMMPVSLSVDDKDLPARKQHGRLKLAVASEHATEVKSHLDYYAEQIRTGSPDFWPGTLEIEVVQTTASEIVQRQLTMRQMWDMRLLELGVAVPPRAEPEPDPTPVEDPELRKAIQQVESSFAEKTRTSDRDYVPIQIAKSDQVLDLKEKEPSESRNALKSLFHAAIMRRASDIHIEYVTDGHEPPYVGIRIRVDGVMQHLVDSRTNIGPQILNILGTMAGAGVEESAFHMRPQDGKIIIRTKDGRRMDGRLAFVPVPISSSSFNCTIRLLDSSRTLAFEKLGLSPRNNAILESGMELEHGMIVLTGPTNSGKTTTIQACLRRIIGPDKKVITIEDPVEYFLRGAEQTQVSHKEPTMSFANLLRSALRRDPDVIMVGEIRDPETAEVAIKAALTGHLVFTTIHANSALAVVDRLVDLGIHPDLVASALEVVGAQRLVRRIVPERWIQTDHAVGDIESRLRLRLAKDDAERARIIRGPRLKDGFDPSDPDNYRGQVGVHEFQAFDMQLKDAIRSGARGSKLFGMARQKGLKTIFQDGLLKAQQGITSFEDLALNLKGT